MFTYFLQGAGLGFSASVTPGPFLAFLMAQTLKNGWKRTLPASLAPLLSDGPIVILVLLVLTQTPAWLLSVLQVAGGLFILYLAKGALFARPAPETPNPELMAEAAHHNFVKAALMNTLSPGPYIFWSLIAGPIVLEAWRQSPGLGLIFVLGFYGTLIGGFAAFVLLFATASRLDPKVSRALTLISGLVLLVFGLYQLSQGLLALL